MIYVARPAPGRPEVIGWGPAARTSGAGQNNKRAQALAIKVSAIAATFYACFWRPQQRELVAGRQFNFHLHTHTRPPIGPKSAARRPANSGHVGRPVEPIFLEDPKPPNRRFGWRPPPGRVWAPKLTRRMNGVARADVTQISVSARARPSGKLNDGRPRVGFSPVVWARRRQSRRRPT